MQPGNSVDICIIGAGVVGLALARMLSLHFPSHEILVLERNAGVGQETSSRNSEVIHAGLYYAPTSNKARLCLRGHALLYDYCLNYNIPYRRIGKLIVAQHGEESQLLKIADRALACGVSHLIAMTKDDVKKMEPLLRAEAALWSPATGIVDSHRLMQSLRQQFEDAGHIVATRSIFRQARGRYGQQPGFDVDIGVEGDSETFSLQCRVLINCAGIAATEVAKRIDGVDTRTIPAISLIKGNYFSLSGRSPFSHLIYPVPDPAHRGLGIHATLDLGGQCRFGPDIEAIDCVDSLDSINSIDYRVNEQRKGFFTEAIRQYYPQLDESRLHPDYSGIRTRLMKTDNNQADFVIQGHEEHGCSGLIQLFGIESPGLTASLAIAEEISEQLKTLQLL